MGDEYMAMTIAWLWMRCGLDHGCVFQHHDGAFDVMMLVMAMEQGSLVGVGERLSIAMALQKGAQCMSCVDELQQLIPVLQAPESA